MKITSVEIDINAHITNIACSVEPGINGAIANISFDNMGYGTITAVKFNAKGFNAFGDIITVGGKEQFFLIVQDIQIKKNASATGLKAKLPDNDMRSLYLEECQLCYDDGSVVSYEGSDIREFKLEELQMFGSEKDSLMAIREMVSSRARFLPIDCDSGWVCSCGRYNHSGAKQCSDCGIDKLKIFRIKEAEYVEQLVKQCREREELRRITNQETENKKKKATRKRNTLIGIGVVAGIIIISIIGHYSTLAGRTTYSSEEEMKHDLQGIYTSYDGYKPEYQLRFDGDTVWKRWCTLGSDYDLDSSIRAWNNKNGTVQASLGTMIVKSNGDILYDGDTYEKGGSWESTASGSYKSSYSDDSPSYEYESGYTALVVSPKELSTNTGYTICTGSVTNTGNYQYTYVKLKGAFTDYNGNVIDTAWTYACGSEGLDPGETTTFRMSVTKNYAIKSCTVSLIDYN